MRLVTLLLALSLGLAALAEPMFEAQISATEISLDETITLTVNVRANSVGKLRFPVETEDFVVVAQSNATNIKIVNGVRSQQHRITLMIQPKHVGKFTLPSASIDAQGFVHSSDPITINVLPAKTVAAASPATTSPVTSSQTSAAAVAPPFVINQDYKTFARLTASNTNPYVGEQLKLKLRLYHQGNVKRINFASDSFNFDNFLQEKIDGGTEGEETIDGVKYYYYEMATILYPIKAGAISIPAQDLKLVVVDVDAMRARAFDPFAQLVNRSFESEQALSSNNLVINVRALPSPIPKNFSGYVGSLSLASDLDKTTVEEGLLLMLSLTATGTGNPKSLVLDLVPKSAQYTVFEDKKTVNASLSGGVRSFRLLVRKVIIPKRSGKLGIELNPLVYFNTNTKRYEIITGSKFELDVSASTGAKPDKEYSEPEQLVAKAELMNIPNTKVLAEHLPPSLPFWLMFLILGLINLAYVVYGLRSKLLKLESFTSAGSVSFTKTAKQVAQAKSIEEISILLKDLCAKFNIRNENLDKFFVTIDTYLYSGQTGLDLELIRTQALDLIEEAKRYAK